MPGKHIASRQVARYMDARRIGRNQTMSADGADISIRTARRLDGAGRAAKPPRAYQMRQNAGTCMRPCQQSKRQRHRLDRRPAQ